MSTIGVGYTDSEEGREALRGGHALAGGRRDAPRAHRGDLRICATYAETETAPSPASEGGTSSMSRASTGCVPRRPYSAR